MNGQTDGHTSLKLASDCKSTDVIKGGDFALSPSGRCIHPHYADMSHKMEAV